MQEQRVMMPDDTSEGVRLMDAQKTAEIKFYKGELARAKDKLRDVVRIATAGEVVVLVDDDGTETRLVLMADPAPADLDASE